MKKTHSFSDINPFTGRASIDRRTETELIEQSLGFSGMLIAYSKSTYLRKFPTHVVYFNGCIFIIENEQPVQIWWGDLDISDKFEAIRELARALQKDIYVAPEHPFRSDFYRVGIKDLNHSVVVFSVILRRSSKSWKSFTNRHFSSLFVYPCQ